MARAPGPTKFAKFLKRNKISIRKAGEALHVTDPTIISWRKGEKSPSPEHRGAIRVWTDGEVSDDDWRTPRELEQAEKALEVRPFRAGTHSEPPPDSGSLAKPSEQAS